MRTQIKRSDRAQGRTQVRRSEAQSAGAYAGNSATEGYLRSMTVSSPGDSAEIEARRNADAVMSGGQSAGQGAGGGSGGFEAPQGVAQGIEAASRGPAQALPKELGGQMASAMGRGFDDVRIHDDPAAHQMSQSLEASAFTTGRDIFFGAGQYQPDSQAGQHLIAHELTHVAQDSGMIFRGLTDQTTVTDNNNPPNNNTTEPPVNSSSSSGTPGNTSSTNPSNATTGNTPPPDPDIGADKFIKDDALNDVSKRLKAKLANPLIKRVVRIMMLIKATTIDWTKANLDDDTLSDTLDMAASGLGLVASTADLGGMVTDSVAEGRGDKAGNESYGSGITDIISGVAGAASSGVSMANTIMGEASNRKQDSDALKSLSDNERQILKDNPKLLEGTGSGDALGSTLKTVGAGTSGVGSLLFGVSGGGVGLSGTYRERNNMDGHEGRNNTAGGLGVAGAGLGAIGSGLGAIADWINVGKTSGGDQALKTFTEVLGKNVPTGTAKKTAELTTNDSLDEKKKTIHSVLKLKKVEDRMAGLKAVHQVLKDDSPGESNLRKATGVYLVSMYSGHGQKKAGKSAFNDALLSTVDTGAGILNTIGVGLTSFMKDNAWAQGFGLAFRGLGALAGMATNAINLRRKTSKQARNKLGKRNDKYRGRVESVINLITGLGDVSAEGISSADVGKFAHETMSAASRAKLKDKNNPDKGLAVLEEYTNMVDVLKGHVNILHLAAAADPDEAFTDENRNKVAGAIAASMGK